jgi:hypothetical protein
MAKSTRTPEIDGTTPPERQSQPTGIQGLVAPVLTSVTTIAVAYITLIGPGVAKAGAEAGTKAGSSSAQEESERQQKELARPVPIIPNSDATVNASPYRLLVLGGCNATVQPKVIEAWVGESPQTLAVVASVSGTDRLNVTFLVPPNWYYRITYPAVEGIGSSFSGWRF